MALEVRRLEFITAKASRTDHAEALQAMETLHHFWMSIRDGQRTRPASREAVANHDDASMAEDSCAEYEKVDDVHSFSIEDLLKRANKNEFGNYAMKISQIKQNK